jgi:hypothetical protein
LKKPAPFDPSTGFPWEQDQGERFVPDAFVADNTVPPFVGSPLNAVQKVAFDGDASETLAVPFRPVWLVSTTNRSAIVNRLPARLVTTSVPPSSIIKNIGTQTAESSTMPIRRSGSRSSVPFRMRSVHASAAAVHRKIISARLKGIGST